MIVRDWVDRARETLGGGVVEQVNRLLLPFIPGDTTLQLEFETDGITRGIPICLGLNTFMVWSVAPATKEVTVQSGWAGSPEVSADIGELVRVRPNVQTHRIFDAINDTLNELSSPMMGVYGVGTLDLVYDPITTNYDLTGAEDIEGVLGVQIGDASDLQSLWQNLRSISQWEHRTTPPSAEVPSGHVLRVFGTIPTDNTTLRVIYRHRLNPVVTLDDDVNMTALPETAYDLPVLGAASRLAIPGEWRRNLLNAQPDPRRADEVAPGAVLGGARALRAHYENRVTQEAARLMSQYSYRMN